MFLFYILIKSSHLWTFIGLYELYKCENRNCSFSFRIYFSYLMIWTIFWDSTGWIKQEAQLSPRDRAMRHVNWNLANCHATVQKLLIRQVLTKLMAWSWRFNRRQCVIDNVHSTMTRPSRFHCLRCVINKPTMDELWISPVYWRLAAVKFSKSTI